MSCREGERQRGFTLIELLIVVAIIGIIAAILVPNMLDAVQKGRQKRTMGDMKQMGTAMVAWLTDHGAAAAAGAAGTVAITDFTGSGDLGEIRTALVPDYAPQVPELDAWNRTFVYRMQLTPPIDQRSMLIVSPGRDGNLDNGGSYTPGSFEPTDYDQDLVWADGAFLRVPNTVRSSPP